MRNVNLTHHSSLFKQKNLIGKSKVCPTTEFSDAGDKIDIDGNTFY